MDNNTRHGLNRRDFLKASAVTAVATALAASPLAGNITFAQSASQDLEILNYALTLEHLEAAAYRAVIGSGLLSGKALEYFQDFGAHEAAHVDALTTTIKSLGGTPVAAQAKYNFPAFKSQQEVLEYFHTVEELGAAAYLGQAPRLMSGDLLTAAVSIHNVEAQHAAVLADMIGVSPAPDFGTPKSMDQVLAVVTPILTVPGSMPSGMPTTGRGGSFRQSGGGNVPY
ncbi:MAG: ferritin-like domain-containing protein [Ardenticatenales bacterium]|nr:ferritin-like domain-containing protein [Ardenticatenales bacterium]